MGVETTPTCMGSVDFFHYENGTLNAIGWAFDPTFASMEQPRIAFYQGTQKLHEASCTTIYRTDVANAIGNPDAESAGFSFLATVLAPAETSVFLEYGTAADTGRFLIGKIREPGIRKNFWYTLSKIRRVSEISAISNSVMYAVRERHIHSRSISRRWM